MLLLTREPWRSGGKLFTGSELFNSRRTDRLINLVIIPLLKKSIISLGDSAFFYKYLYLHNLMLHA